MSAIITENFRRNNTSSFIADLAANNYYVGLGKSDKWTSDEQAYPTVPNPIGTFLDEREIKSNLISLIGVNAVNGTRVIPNNKFLAGKIYKAYDPLNDNCFYSSTVNSVTSLPCYVTVSENIFLCLYSPGTAAISVPTYSTIKYKPFTTGDGYVWILLDIIAINSANTINTDQFVSITSDTPPDYETALSIPAQGGLLYGFTVIDGGTGYTSVNAAFTYSYKTSGGVTGTKTGTATITSGSITNLPFNIISSAVNNVVSGVITLDSPGGGSGFKAIAKIAPVNGFAYQPYKILPAWYAAVSVKAESLISGDGFYIPYRQISLIKNPEYNTLLVSGNSSVSLRALPYLILSGAPTTTLVIGDILTINGTTQILFDSFDTTNNYLYYHQNNISGYGNTSFISPTITKDGYTIGQTVLNSILGEYKANSGDVIFIENRKAIARSASQTEEIKIIIQF